MCESTREHEMVTQRRLLLPSSLVGQIEQHAARAFPEECCGILIGAMQGAGVFVQRAAAADNIAAGDRGRQYQIDWASLFMAVRQTRDSSEAIVGFYHSHPDGSYHPSFSDMREAWIDYAYLIVGVSSGGVTGMASWRVHEEGAPFTREMVERTESR